MTGETLTYEKLLEIHKELKKLAAEYIEIAPGYYVKSLDYNRIMDFWRYYYVDFSTSIK